MLYIELFSVFFNADYEQAKEDDKYNWRKCRILQVGINEVIS